MIKKKSNNKQRLLRHKRVRAKIDGTGDIPRLCVFRSNKHIYAQIIDDTKGITLCSASTVEKSFSGKTADIEAADKIGRLVGERAVNLGIKQVVFDRGGYIYHGRVQAVADGAREVGLDF